MNILSLKKHVTVLLDVIQDQRETIDFLKKSNSELKQRIKRRDELIAFYRDERTKGEKL